MPVASASTRPAAVAAYLDQQQVLRSLFDSVFVADARLHLIAVAENGGVRIDRHRRLRPQPTSSTRVHSRAAR